MFQHILGSEARHVGGDLVHGEANVMQGPLLLVVGDVRLVLLGHAHPHVTLGRPAAGDLDVELRVHRGSLCNEK